MSELRHSPVKHDHAAFLARAAQRQGFSEAYAALELEYAVVSQLLADGRADVVRKRRQPQPIWRTIFRTVLSQEVHKMRNLSASEARSNLYRLMDQAAESHQPIVITGRRHDAVLVSAEDWSAIQETLYLLSVPGMRESIKEGLSEPIEACARELDW